MIADIVNAVWRPTPSRLEVTIVSRRIVEGREYPRKNIINEGKVTLHPPAIVHFDRLASQDLVGKPPYGHVRAAPRSVYREKAQSRLRDPVEVRIGLAHQLIGLLRGGIKRYWKIDPCLNAKWQIRARTI